MNAPNTRITQPEESVPYVRQHLIDPELCVACGSCQMACNAEAIQMDSHGYCFVIDPDKCDNEHQCLEVCSTDAIRSWRMVPAGKSYSLEEQLSWDVLPADLEVNGQAIPLALDEDESPQGHPAPASASEPQTYLYTQSEPLTVTIKSNTRVTAESSETDIHHIVLDFGATDFSWLEGQNIGVLPPGIAADGRAHHLRAYSIASDRDGETAGSGEMALTIKRVIDEWEGKPYHGVASNFMCDLAPGDSVKVVGPIGSHFLMPQDPAARIMMICTGTGIAPMRGFIQRQQRINPEPGHAMQLFYGGRCADEMAYFEDLQSLPDKLLQTHLAISRDAGRPKRYVQEVLTEQADLVFDFLQDSNSYIFICGLLSMERGVMDAFADIAARHQMSWEQLHHDLLHEGRLQIETY